MKLSIRNKLLLSFTLVLLVSYFIQALGFRVTENSLKTQTSKLHLEKAQSAAAEIDAFLTKNETDLLGIATNFREESQSDYAQVNLIISYVLQQNEFFKKITVLTLSGRELIKVDRFGQTPDDNLEFEIQTSPFQQALSGSTGISKVYFAEATSIPQIDMFSPVFSTQGKVIAVVKGQITLGRLWDLIAQVKVGETGFAYIVDDEGRVIAHPSLELVLRAPNFSDRKIVSSLLQGTQASLSREEFVYINEDHLQVFSNGVRIPQVGWAVLVEQPTTQAFAQLNTLQNLFYTTLLGSFLLLLLVSLFLSESFTRPIRVLEHATDQLKQGQFDTNAQIHTGDEIEELANSFNIMAQRLKVTIDKLEHALRQEEQLSAGLEREKEQRETLLQSLTDGVFAVDTKYRILLFNKAAESITGFSSKDVIGKHADEVLRFTRSGKRVSILEYKNQREQKEEDKRHSEVLIQTPDKGNVYLSLLGSPVTFEGPEETGWIITFHDVSQERQLEEMKLDFVSMAAHELRTPLTIISGYMSVFMEENKKKLTKDQKTLLNRVIIAAQQLSALVENLLNVSQIERGSLTLSLLPIDWISTVKKTISDLTNRTEDKHLELTFSEPQNPIPKVRADKLRILEVLHNLLSNAISYTNPGGKVTVKIETNPYEVITHITDSGIGIPKEALPRLFTKFFRVSGVLEQGSKGTGLGLYISKAIIEMHHGRIWVQSEEGKGSTFSFAIPIANND